MLNDPSQSSAPPTVSASTREKDDDYCRVVAVLNDNWRVIECKDGIQWIIQKASPSEWRSKKYLRDRESLIQRVRSLCGPVNDTAMARLVALPDWIHQTQVQLMEMLP